MRCLNDHQIPNQAAFCPHCGAGAAEKPFNTMLLRDLDGRSDVDFESYEMPRRKAGLWIGVVAAALVAAGGIAFGLSEPEPVAPLPVAEVVVAVAPAAAALPVIAPLFKGEALQIALAPAVSTISYEGRPLVDVWTAVGSRYSTMDERTKAIEVRIRHAWETSAADQAKPVFTAVARGNSHEVVWTRTGETDFRVMDVTDRDVQMWQKANGKTTRAALAKLIAARLGGLAKNPSNS